MKKISRITANAKGLKRYYTGEPCTEDHDAERYVSNASCCECTAEANARTAANIRAARGAIKVEVLVHPDDKKAIWAYAKKLRTERGLK